MEVTRRYWTVAGLGAFLALWGVIVAEPLVSLGTAAVAAWLLARQYRFVRAASEVPSALTVHLTTDRRVMARDSSQVSLDAALDGPVSVRVDVTVTPPVGARGEPATVGLGPENRRGFEQSTVTWPVAGAFGIDDVTAAITDGGGLFRQTVELDTGVTVDVDPRAPRDVHVGEGGRPISVGFGEHDAGQAGSDVEPAEVREYVPGDAVRQIDWKSTARLDRIHVREFEGKTDRETLLFFDHRATMADGRPGTRKLDYARQLAVALVDQADRSDDQFGYYAVGDEGITEMVDPKARVDAWRPIRDHLYAVEPTNSAPGTSGALSPASARGVSVQLDPSGSPFDRTLAPYFADRGAYRRRFDTRPLYRAVRGTEFPNSTAVWTAIVTDDSNQTELREAVKHARSRSDQVTVFVTPSALFPETDPVDLDRVYDRYVEFEEFRRELASVGRVSAYEVGPADRLAAVLSAGERRRRGRNA